MRTITIPAMLDPHTHLRGMQWSYKATFATETAAAVAGGYWAVLDMPNTPPTTISRTALNTKLDEISAQAMCDWGIYFGASQDENQGEFTDIFPDVCGLKIFNNATTGDLLIQDQGMRDRMFAAWPDGKVIAVHAEDQTVLDVLALVRRYRKPTHFLHISTADEILFLTAAKAEGLPVTVGVCPHHLWLTEDDLPSLGSLGLMKPTLKTSRDRDMLWAAIRDGIVDVIESDHAPHTLEEKNGLNPPYGVPGLETTLPLLCTAVHEQRLDIEDVIALISEKPRRIFGLNAPHHTYAVVDLDASSVITRTNLHTACGWSPFEGMRVYGKVTQTWIRGQQVFDGERVTVPNGFGRNLYA